MMLVACTAGCRAEVVHESANLVAPGCRNFIALMYRHARHSAKGAQVVLLVHWLVWAVRPGTDQSRKIFDFGDGIFRQQQLAELANIKPAIGGFSQRPVIEIESICQFHAVRQSGDISTR